MDNLLKKKTFSNILIVIAMLSPSSQMSVWADVVAQSVASVSDYFTWPVDPTNPTKGHYNICSDEVSNPRGCYWISDTSHVAITDWRDAQPFQEHHNSLYGYHLGADYNLGSGDDDLNKNVYPTAAGKISQVLDNVCGYGNIVFVKHNTSFGARIYTSMYAHVNWLASGRPKIGADVTPNNPIAVIGKGNWTQTTRCSTSGSYPAHLHFEIRRGDNIVPGPAYWKPGPNEPLRCDGSDNDNNNCPRRQVNPNAFIAAHNTEATFSTCNTLTPENFYLPVYKDYYKDYGAPFDLFGGNAMLVDAKCSSSDKHTIKATLGIPGNTTRLVYMKGYYYDPSISNWKQYTATCNGTINGDWCAGSATANITDPNISTDSASAPTFFVGYVCSWQNGQWKCGCRDTTCASNHWQIQRARR